MPSCGYGFVYKKRAEKKDKRLRKNLIFSFSPAEFRSKIVAKATRFVALHKTYNLESK